MTFAILLILLSAFSPAQAQESEPEVYITGAWVRPALVETGGLTAVYLTLENPGVSPLRLAGVAAPVAAEAQIHESRMVDNVMQMRPVDGIDLAPGDTAALEPGGYHLMLLGLQHDLAVGEAISLDLTFDQPDGGDPLTRTIGVPVLDEAPPPPDLVVLDAWARPTAFSEGMNQAESMPGMTMGDEQTPEASMDTDGMNMDMGGAMSATEDAMTVTSDVTAVYMRLLNRGTADDRIVGAQSDVSGMVEIHESQVVDNVMQMRPVAGIDLLHGETAVLEPGGYHIMVMDVQRGLVVGDAFTVTLLFASGLELPVAVPVRDNLNG